MQQGTIGVTTENIFPIIKKFLYSDHEIFLRELISNAVDATQKLKTISSTGESTGEIGDTTIRISVDAKKKTLTISDRGCGMTEEEVQKYINQIAFSSAGEFMEKYKNQANAIIGHFGLGFYSAFMVSGQVDIYTKSWQEDAKAVKWSCDGSPEYTIEETQKEERGTDIVLHIDDDSKEFLEESRINDLLRKYCRFLPVDIAFGKEKEWKDGKQVETDKDKIINNTTPAWTRKPSDLKEEDYASFYRELYPMAEDPLFHIHLNVDYPFNLTGILYFPKIKNNIEVQKNKIQLYCNQVYVTDSVEGIVPDFMTLLHGVLDSPDIPLNVSRSYLQSDSNVKKISNHITKKVADRLEEIFKNERAEYEQKWDNLKLFIEYGMLTEEKFYDRAEKFALLKNTENQYFTFEEYKKLIEANQTDKNKKLVYLYSTNATDQFSFIEAARNKGYDVLLMDGNLDVHFINHVESKFSDAHFARVDADVVDRLIQKDELRASTLPADKQEELKPVLDALLPKSANFFVTFEDLGPNGQPVVITQSEFMRRMKDMSAMGGGGMNFYGELPDSYSLVVNTEHPLIKELQIQKEADMGTQMGEINANIAPVSQELSELKESIKDKKEDELEQSIKDKRAGLQKQEEELKDRKKEALQNYGTSNKLAKQLIDLALLSNNMLKGEALNSFVKRSIELMK